MARLALVSLGLAGLLGCVEDTTDLSLSLDEGGEGTATGSLVITPSRVDFGTVLPSCPSVSREGQIYNGSPYPFRLEAIELEGGAPFDVSSPPLPASLAPGQTLTWTAELTGGSAAEGRHSASVRFLLRRSDGLLVEALRPLVVTLDPTPIRTDRFVQRTRAAADVLFVIDDSASMAAEQADLRENFDAFLRAADQGLADYRIGVTTTDMSERGAQGRLVPLFDPDDPDYLPERVVTRASFPSPLAVFRENADVGIAGDARERGLEAAVAALTPPLTSSDNANFLREDAALALIFVSDEDDRSGLPASVAANLLRSVKASTGRAVSASAIVGPPGGCVTETGRASEGTKYRALADALGGITESICTESWGDALARLSGVAFGLVGSFTLSAPPVGEPTVTVDGRVRERINAVGQTVWAIDAETRVLSFGTQFTPGEGAQVEVSYRVGCPEG